MKSRYIKINTVYYPIDTMAWLIMHDGMSVEGYAIGNTSKPMVIVRGEDATNLIGLLDEMSLPIEFLREGENG